MVMNYAHKTSLCHVSSIILIVICREVPYIFARPIHCEPNCLCDVSNVVNHQPILEFVTLFLVRIDDSNISGTAADRNEPTQQWNDIRLDRAV